MIEDNAGWVVASIPEKNLTPQLIENIERQMLEYPQVDCPVSHHFGPGIYIREVRMPAGSLVVGHKQKKEHLNVMIAGRVVVLNKDRTTMEICAPCTFVGKPGRKIGFILEDVVWQNIYATEETRIEVLEETYLEKSVIFTENNKVLGDLDFLSREPDREDYKKMLAEYSIDEETVRRQSENEEDQTIMPYGFSGVAVFQSSIEGKGLFSSCGFNAGDIIAPARISGMRTPAGRYTNHSINPNSKMISRHGGDIYLVAARNISGCKGGDCGEEITIDYRQALSLSNVIPIGVKKCLE